MIEIYIYRETNYIYNYGHIGFGQLHEKENEDNGEAELPMELLQVPGSVGSVPNFTTCGTPQLHDYLYTLCVSVGGFGFWI